VYRERCCSMGKWRLLRLGCFERRQRQCPGGGSLHTVSYRDSPTSWLKSVNNAKFSVRCDVGAH